MWAATFVGAAVPVVLLGSMGYARRWVAEDAFIDLRIVRHLLAGYGPIFNVGERVEAYTSPLWIAILTAWGATGGSPELGAMALGMVGSLAGIVLAQAAAMKLGLSVCESRRSDSRWLGVPLGATVFAVVPIVWDFVTSGLESGLVFAWMGGAFWLLARADPLTPRRARVAALALGCGPLVRPDLAFFSAGFAAALAAICWTAESRPPATLDALRLVLIAAGPSLAYQVFRMGYFAALVPNTAIAKEAGGSYWTQGWRYTEDFVGTYVLWFPLLIVAAWMFMDVRAARQRRAWGTTALVLAPVLSALAHWLYITRVGGDFMHGRLLLPSLFGFLLPVSSVVMSARRLRSVRTVALAAVGVWAIACALWFRVSYAGSGGPGPWGVTDERGYYTHHMQRDHPTRIEHYLQHPYIAEFNRTLLRYDHVIVVGAGQVGSESTITLNPRTSTAVRLVVPISNIGVLGYIAGPDVHIVDRMGLADPLAARLLLESRGTPGHEKLLPWDWIAARFGDPAVGEARYPETTDAARALGCGDLALLVRAVTAPLTPSRFLANIRDAWTLTLLRIPAVPGTARERFCPSTRSGRRAQRAS